MNTKATREVSHGCIGWGEIVRTWGLMERVNKERDAFHAVGLGRGKSEEKPR